MTKQTKEFTSLECISQIIYPDSTNKLTLVQKRAQVQENLAKFGGADKLLPLATKENSYKVYLSEELGSMKIGLVDALKSHD